MVGDTGSGACDSHHSADSRGSARSVQWNRKARAITARIDGLLVPANRRGAPARLSGPAGQDSNSCVSIPLLSGTVNRLLGQLEVCVQNHRHSLSEVRVALRVRAGQFFDEGDVAFGDFHVDGREIHVGDTLAIITGRVQQ